MNKSILRRLRIFLLITIIIMGILTARLAQLQIVDGDYYKYRSEENKLRVLSVMAPRGEIFDRDGLKLVSNRTGFTVSLGDVPRNEQEEVIVFLSELLDIDIETIKQKIQEQRYRRYLPIRLKTHVDLETIARIEERRMELPGVMIEVEPIRNNVYDSAASHILGYTGEGKISTNYINKWREEGYEYRLGDVTGQDGIELVWEPYLRGQDGGILVEVNSVGRPVKVQEKIEPVPGNDLYLTLDFKLQKDTERFLREQLSYLQQNGYPQAEVASAVVLDPNTGRILAMASYPDYNPNTFSQDYPSLSQDSLKPLFNRAIKGAYPGGSTFKLVTTTAALEESKVRIGEILRCYGSLTRYGTTKTCYNGMVHGAVDLYNAIVRSCNVYFYELGLRVGIDNLSYYAGEYGFGRRTGLTDIPGELPGSVASRETKFNKLGIKTWYPSETMDAAIGQGLHDFTPLQLANYAAIIANGGFHYKPYLVDKAVSHEGEVVYEAVPQANRINVSDETISFLQRAMQGVTQPGGTAGFLGQLPIKTAGKTGSAEAGKKTATHGVFIGYAPAENPQIAFAVLVEHGGTGGRAAAPVAQKIMESYFGFLEELEEEDKTEVEVKVIEGNG
ncbi:MAG: penicillin-binding protein 2 [Firmicutes bacterium HGW-Firmicutes-13]|nr:MAG: penicillin-binding protein 2 [Firmicutes bacterium HGW-Firmicutes-13]